MLRSARSCVWGVLSVPLIIVRTVSVKCFRVRLASRSPHSKYLSSEKFRSRNGDIYN